LLLAWPAQFAHAPPVVPHAEAAVPTTHVPELQQPPLQNCDDEQDVVHVVPLHAYPGGQSEVKRQLSVHCPLWQVAPPLQAYGEPQPPQLFTSLVKSTHAPLQRLKPLRQVSVQEPETHVGSALGTLVEQVTPHIPQLLVSLEVLTHAPPQRVGVDAGQPEAHA
jgi:hypothetical protein